MAIADKRLVGEVGVYAPAAQVFFHTDNGSLGINTESLVSCQTYKDIGQPTGTFMVHLTDNGRPDRDIHAMDLCTVKMTRDRREVPMIGLVDEVRRKKLIDPNTGKPNVFCEVRGRDFGKLLVKHQVRYIPLLQNQEGKLGTAVQAMFKQLLSGFYTGGSIDELMAHNLQAFFSRAVDVEFNFNGKKVNLKNALSYRAMKRMGVIPYNLGLQAQEGSLYSILVNYANLPFNELWVDTLPDPRALIGDADGVASPFSSPMNANDVAASQELMRRRIASQSGQDKELSIKLFGARAQNIMMPVNYAGTPDDCRAYTTLMFRRTPFDQRDWESLPRTRITNADIVEQDLGHSDNETYNFFWVYPLLAIPGPLPMKGLGIMPMLFSKEIQFDTSLSGSKGISGPPKAVVLSKSANSNAPVGSDSQLSSKHATFAQHNAVEKFGFCPMEVQTRIWRWAGSKQLGNSIDTARLLTLALANWNKHNSVLEQGSMTIKGIPGLRVGTVLVNDDEGLEFYVEAVSQNYVQYQAQTTTVIVTRGQPPKGKPGAIDWGNAYSDYCGNPVPVGAQAFGPGEEP